MHPANPPYGEFAKEKYRRSSLSAVPRKIPISTTVYSNNPTAQTLKGLGMTYPYRINPVIGDETH
jgi:hypothetical protein